MSVAYATASTLTCFKMENSKNTQITLSIDEALVLFEWLQEFEEESITDPLVLKVLNNILTDFEKQLTEPFQKNYKEILAQARINLQ